MFKIHYLTVGFILSSYISVYARDNAILLTSDAMKFVKTFVDLPRITQMQKFRKDILGIVFGKLQSDRTRKGDYLFEGSYYSVQGLKEQEATLESNKNILSFDEYTEKKAALYILLEKAKQDFKDKGEEFRSVSNAKKIMATLIEESLIKRNRQDSILLSWTQSKCDEDEEKIFQEEVLTFKIFEEFLLDLYNFLGDLIESCPEAHQQYELQLKKYRKIHQLSAPLFQKNESIQSFLNYVSNNYLEKLKLDDITPEKIKHLYDLYKKQQRNL